MKQPPTDAERLNELELSLMHLQRDYDKLNEVVIEQANRLQQLHASLNKLSGQFEQSQHADTPRSLEDEKPPHY